MNDCLFCKIVKGDTPSKKVYEDNDILAFYDTHPLAPIHVLVIPKKHIVKLSEAGKEDENLLGKLQLMVAKIAKELKIDDAFRLFLCNGEKAGQSVLHIHYHLRGGWEKPPGDI
jgi:histidine triad (HIT) family protein